MVLAPKTKLIIGVGIFALIILGLLSLRGNTFSGNLSLVLTTGNPKICTELQKACTEGGGTGIPCDNHAQLCKNIDNASVNESQTDENSSEISPRRARPRPQQQNNNFRGAAPELDQPQSSDTSENSSAEELDEVLRLYPESPSQGTLDINKLR